MTRDSLPPILPVGTSVVTRVEVQGKDGRPTLPRQATGVIVRAPADAEHSYRVRFPDGTEVSMKRGDLHVLKQFQELGMRDLGDAMAERDSFRR